ncbi:MAG: HD domain-containing protein [Gemmatales bacterium]|nr:HD domain-containing protein [Gemmatales bacterium]
MPTSRLPIVPLHALPVGQLADCFALLAEKTRQATREGKLYYACRFRDKLRSVTCILWSDGPWFEACERTWKEGECYKLRVIYSEHERYGPQIELHNIRPVTDADSADGFDLRQLVESSRFSSENLWHDLMQFVQQQLAEPWRKLVLFLLNKYESKIKRLPASERQYYPFVGGWLEHTLSVCRLVAWLADYYRQYYSELQPPLNRDLVLAAAVLHEIGRVVEFGEEWAQPQPTVPGRLLGHLQLARDLIREAASQVPELGAEHLLLLDHLILSYLTLPEWGSQRLPMIPEALILHHADDLDAKMEMYYRCLSRDNSPGPFTARDPILGRPLLKQRPC